MNDFKILLVDDEQDVLEFMKYNLEKEGFWVYTATNGADGIQLAKKIKPHLIVLDLMMPVKDGITTCRELRAMDEFKHTLITFLTARDEDYSQIAGFESGADDYITKPFDSEVLLLKIKAILKRNEELNKESDNLQFDLGRYHFNPKLRELSHDGQTQTLSPKENELLKMLSEHKNDLLPRERALKKIWGSDTYFNGRSMDVYIAKLRKYLKEDTNIEIVNIHGNGFRLVVTEQ